MKRAKLTGPERAMSSRIAALSAAPPVDAPTGGGGSSRPHSTRIKSLPSALIETCAAAAGWASNRLVGLGRRRATDVPPFGGRRGHNRLAAVAEQQGATDRVSIDLDACPGLEAALQ